MPASRSRIDTRPPTAPAPRPAASADQQLPVRLNSPVVTVLGMLVADLYHFLDLTEDTPGPARRRLAGHLSNIVRAATAGDAGTAWMTALPCPRRPAHRSCVGRMIVFRPEPAAPTRWQCSVCDDEGVISNWAESPTICAVERSLSPARSTKLSSPTRSLLRCASCCCWTPTANVWCSRCGPTTTGSSCPSQTTT